MRVRALVAALAVAAASSGLVAGVASAATSPTPATNALTVEGGTDTYVGGTAGSWAWTGSQVTADAYPTALSLTVPTLSSATTAGISWGSATPAAGTYAVVDHGQESAGKVGMDLSIYGAQCYTPTGTVVVHDVAVDGSGDISTLAATYQVSCNGAPTVSGELRYASAVPYERFGNAQLGVQSASHPVTVTVDQSTTFGTAALTGPATSSFGIRADGCSGQTLAAGQSCTVRVVTRPQTSSGVAAVLTLPSSTGTRVVGLTAGATESAAGAYTSLTPSRILDTRKRVGIPTTTPLGQNAGIDVQAVNVGGLPTGGIAAVVATVTVVSPSASGYLTVYPSGAARPTVSSINFSAGTTTANLVTVPIGSNGKIHVYNYAGSTHVLVDVVGFYHSASSTAVDSSYTPINDFFSVTPHRVTDTRTDGSGPLPGGYYLTQPIDYGDADNARIRAVAVNITVVGPQRAGYLTAFDGVSDQLPNASTLNFTPYKTVADMAIIRTGTCSSTCGTTRTLPTIGVYNGSPGAAHIVIDVVGIYVQDVTTDRGWRYHSLASPTRVVDSRKGQGLVTNLTAGATRPVTVPSPVADYNTYAVVSNVTAAAPTGNTYLTLWRNQSTQARPGVSNLNAAPGQVVSNMAMTEVWTQNDLQIFNAVGTTPVVMDVAGTMEAYPGSVDTGTSALHAAAAASVAPRVRALSTPVPALRHG